MVLLTGLGNPGPQYVGTRHNAGFEVLDLVADKWGIDINKNKFKGMVGEGFIKGKKVVLLKPMTFMNLSGESVVAALNFFKPAADEFIVIYDDVSLKRGAIRIRKKGSSGGHNGIKSIIALTGSDEFHRIKVGVGHSRGNMVSHVLGRFSEEEAKEYGEGILLAREALEMILDKGIDEAMNKFNSSGKIVKVKPENQEKPEKLENQEKPEKPEERTTSEGGKKSAEPLNGDDPANGDDRAASKRESAVKAGARGDGSAI